MADDNGWSLWQWYGVTSFVAVLRTEVVRRWTGIFVKEFDDSEEEGDDEADDGEDVAEVQFEEVVEG